MNIATQLLFAHGHFATASALRALTAADTPAAVSAEPAGAAPAKSRQRPPPARRPGGAFAAR